MKIHPDDPKWTAYVLGELSEAERTQVEKELESSAAAREVVEEIRLAASLLREELAKEPVPALSGDQKRTIAAAAAPQRMRPVFRWAAAAASVAFGVFIVSPLLAPSLLRSKKAVVESEVASIPPREEMRATAGALKDEAAPTTRDKADAAADVSESIALKKEVYAQKVQPERQGEQRQQALQPEQGLQAQQGQQGQQAQQSGRASENFRPYRVESMAAAPPPQPTASPRGAPGAGGGIGFAENRLAQPLIAPAAPAEMDRADRVRSNNEAYDLISDNPFVRVAEDPRATFSIDVDTASYANVRRFLTMNQLPPKDSVRIEEMINYFTYEYPSPTGRHPIAAYTEVAAAPWKPDHRLVRIGIKAKEIDMAKRPPSNLVFLIDVSASMATPAKLPLLKAAMKLMVQTLGKGDHVAIVTYAGASGLRLPSTPGDRKDIINSVIDGLTTGGSTNGASGIQLAYDTATLNFIRGGTNRVILATDGDFNVGVTSQGDLIRLIEDKAKSGVFLSVLGFGMGNYKDSTLEKVADKGNGNYAYIDTLNEARKVLVDEMSGTLLTVAKDVKVQVEFNPAEVNAYRLIGYENRALRHEDFNNDKKDAGDMGAGHSVTALFEVVPRGVEINTPGVDPLKYQEAAKLVDRTPRGEILNLKIRYKEPEADTSQSFEAPVMDRGAAFNNASADFRFAAAVASFGMILRESPHKGQSSLDAVIDIGEKSRGSDKNGYREEFLRLVRKTRDLR
jgi:Ca-activated chloride channel homolog